MAAKAFIEQYMECMDSLPIEVQRRVSKLREVEYQVQPLLEEIRIVRERCDGLVSKNDGGSNVEQRGLFAKLQAVMLALREVGNEELEVTSQMLDTVEDYHQQLTLSEKEMDNCRTRDELTGTRSSAAPLHNHKSAVTPPSMEVVEKKKADKGHKRARTVTHDKVHVQAMEEDGPMVVPSNREPASKPREAMGGAGNSANSTPLKPPKKKVKVKKSSRQSSRESLAPILPIPQPDFSTEPIDPDEPTYCLCQQVSFGEMIGCDNDDCAIEWFHFQCVGLTSKPKGKWYCPQCITERNRHRTGKS